MPWISFPTLSRLTLVRSFVCTSGSIAATAMASSSANPNLDAKRTARKMRSGSSRNVVRGGRGVRITPSFKSSRPLPVKSSTTSSLML